MSVVILTLFTLFILRANELKTGFIALGTKKTKNLPRSEARNQIRKKKVAGLANGSLVKSQMILLYSLNRSDALRKIKSVNCNSQPSIQCTNTYANYDKLVCCVFNFFFPALIGFLWQLLQKNYQNDSVRALKIH